MASSVYIDPITGAATIINTEDKTSKSNSSKKTTTKTTTKSSSNKLTFEKRVNPDGWTLYKNNKYYKPPLNNQLFNTATGGNCVWYAYGRFLEVWSQAPEAQKKAHPWPGWFSNNGVGMVSSAKNKGFKTGLTPKPGAIISWGYNGSPNGNPGHVAFVEQVNKDSSGKIVSIEVSQSGWSKGNLKNQTIYPGPGTVGTKSWIVNSGYSNPCFVGFAYNPITFDGSDGIYSVNEQTLSEEAAENQGQGIDFQKRASLLVSSDNYSFITTKKQEQAANSEPTILQDYKRRLEEVKPLTTQTYSSGGETTNLFQLISDTFVGKYNTKSTTTPIIPKVNSTLSIADNVVEAPFIELEIGGYKIGSYGGSLDAYPNYISELQVTKQNGVINQYIIRLTHQIRPGDDSNLLDELLSTVNYDQISIRYGDCGTDTYFRDDNAIITNVTMNRSYTNMNISYTVEATSEGQLIKTYTSNYTSVTDRPSNVLRNLIYSSGEKSEIFLNAFPGMRNKTFVESNSLLPTNDAIVNLDAQQNVNMLDYVNYLVGNMSNEKSVASTIRDSSYYVSYVDNDVNADGAYIKVSEVTADVNPYALTDKMYYVTIGYPSEIVYDFSVDSTDSWELLYKNSTKSPEYFYSIGDTGDLRKYYSPSLSTTTNIMSEIDKNWWTQMVNFPITAKLTIKGLLKPVMLMDYIHITVVFYGQEHITSGVYAVTGQEDILSGAGYRTILSLVRVSGT